MHINYLLSSSHVGPAAPNSRITDFWHVMNRTTHHDQVKSICLLILTSNNNNMQVVESHYQTYIHAFMHICHLRPSSRVVIPPPMAVSLIVDVSFTATHIMIKSSWYVVVLTPNNNNMHVIESHYHTYIHAIMHIYYLLSSSHVGPAAPNSRISDFDMSLTAIQITIK